MTSETQNLDAPPLDNLDDAFTLPEPYSTDERALRWHTEIVDRMRREAAGIPMNTAQILLMERIAFFYVVNKYKEWNEGGVSGRELKDMNSAFLSMLDTFNRLLEKHNDKVAKENMGKIEGIINEILPMVSNEGERKRIQSFLINSFATLEY